MIEWLGGRSSGLLSNWEIGRVMEWVLRDGSLVSTLYYRYLHLKKKMGQVLLQAYRTVSPPSGQYGSCFNAIFAAKFGLMNFGTPCFPKYRITDRHVRKVEFWRQARRPKQSYRSRKNYISNKSCVIGKTICVSIFFSKSLHHLPSKFLHVPRKYLFLPPTTERRIF